MCVNLEKIDKLQITFFPGRDSNDLYSVEKITPKGYNFLALYLNYQSYFRFLSFDNSLSISQILL